MKKSVVFAFTTAAALFLTSCATAVDPQPSYGNPVRIPIEVENGAIVDPGDDHVRVGNYVIWHAEGNRLLIELEGDAVAVLCDGETPNQRRVICRTSIFPGATANKAYKYKITVWQNGKQIGPLDPKIIVDP